MKIEQLSLTNFRCFESLEIGFHHELTVLVGANGAGKTAILEALTAAYGTFLGSFDEVAGVHFVPGDARLARLQENSLEMEAQYPVALSAQGIWAGNSHFWSRSLMGSSNKTTIRDATALTNYGKELQVQLRKDPNLSLPLLAYYGTGRLWNIGRVADQERALLSASRTAGYKRCMDSVSNYKEFAFWLRQAFLAITEEQGAVAQGAQRSGIGKRIQDLVKAIQVAVNQCLEHVAWHDLFYSFRTEQIMACHKEQGVIPVNLLSDGVRNLLSLAADIAYRCCKLNGHLGADAPLKTQGIVMIDEIDMHLHPRWQQEVVGAFQRAFPAIQFVLTTHSPHLISAVPSECIRIFEEGRVCGAPAGVKGADSSRILSNVFGTQSRPPKDQNTILLNKYLGLVFEDQWQSEEALSLRKELDAIFQGEEPELTRADIRIQNRKWELDDEAGQ